MIYVSAIAIVSAIKIVYSNYQRRFIYFNEKQLSFIYLSISMYRKRKTKEIKKNLLNVFVVSSTRVKHIDRAIEILEFFILYCVICHSKSTYRFLILNHSRGSLIVNEPFAIAFIFHIQ